MQTLARLTYHNHIITSIRQRPDASSIFLVTITDPNNDQIAHFTTSPAIKSHTAALETGKRVLNNLIKTDDV